LSQKRETTVNAPQLLYRSPLCQQKPLPAYLQALTPLARTW
jgi:hypothetical protein